MDKGSAGPTKLVVHQQLVAERLAIYTLLGTTQTHPFPQTGAWACSFKRVIGLLASYKTGHKLLLHRRPLIEEFVRLSEFQPRPDTINTRPRSRPSLQLEMDRPGLSCMKTIIIRASIKGYIAYKLFFTQVDTCLHKINALYFHAVCVKGFCVVTTHQSCKNHASFFTVYSDYCIASNVRGVKYSLFSWAS